MYLKNKLLICLVLFSFWKSQSQIETVNTPINTPINTNIGDVGMSTTLKLIASPNYEINSNGSAHFKSKSSIVLKPGFKTVENSHFKATIDENYIKPKIIFWGAMDPEMSAKYRDQFYYNSGFDGLVYPYILRGYYNDIIGIQAEAKGRLKYANEKFTESYLRTGCYQIIDWFDDNKWNNNLIPKFTQLTQIAIETNSRGLIIDSENYANSATNPGVKVPHFGISTATDAVLNYWVDREDYREIIFNRAKQIGVAVGSLVYTNNYEDEFVFGLAQEGWTENYNEEGNTYAFLPYYIMGILDGLKTAHSSCVDTSRKQIEMKFFWEGSYNRITETSTTLYPPNLADSKTYFLDKLSQFLIKNTGNFTYNVNDYFNSNFKITMGAQPILYKDTPGASSPEEFQNQIELLRQYSSDYIWVYTSGHNWWQVMSPNNESTYNANEFWSFTIENDLSPGIWCFPCSLATTHTYNRPIPRINEYYQIVKDSKFYSENPLSGGKMANSLAPLNETINKLILYPNPISNIATLEFSASKPSKISIILYDLNGKVVKSIVTNKNFKKGNYKEVFNITNLKQNIYLLNLTVNSQKYSFKLLKN